MLSSSLDLSSHSQSLLLRLSDLAPGIDRLSFDSYWSGVPLKSEGLYALLHTWAAPEMSRPGCVWTHVLLIDFSDMAQIVDMSMLRKKSIRPNSPTSFIEYSKCIPLELKCDNLDVNIPLENHLIDYIAHIIRSLYDGKPTPCVIANWVDYEEAIFRVWSQQWPRLRRSFAFRTVGSANEKSLSEYDLDFHLLLISTNSNFNDARFRSEDKEVQNWEIAVIDDAISKSPTKLRRFLWRYGSDIPNGVAAFKTLSKLFLESQNEFKFSKDYELVCDLILDLFPDREVASLLKEELFSLRKRDFSLLPSIEPLVSYQYVLKRNFPSENIPSDSYEFDHLSELLLNRPKELLGIADSVANSKSLIVKKFVSKLADIIDPNSFFRVTKDYLKIRKRLVKERPALICSSGLAKLTEHEILSLLQTLGNDKKLNSRLISKLLEVDSAEIVEFAIDRFPLLTLECVTKKIEKSSSIAISPVSKSWTNTINLLQDEFIEGNFLESSSSINALAIYAEVLGYSNRKLVVLGPMPWADALSNSVDEILEEHRDNFYSFLLTLVIKNPQPGCEPIFELTFDCIYNSLAGNKLNIEASKLIESTFSFRSWWDSWDRCFYLCHAVSRAFREGGLSKKGLLTISKNKNAISLFKSI